MTNRYPIPIPPPPLPNLIVIFCIWAMVSGSIFLGVRWVAADPVALASGGRWWPLSLVGWGDGRLPYVDLVFFSMNVIYVIFWDDSKFFLLDLWWFCDSFSVWLLARSIGSNQADISSRLFFLRNILKLMVPKPILYILPISNVNGVPVPLEVPNRYPWTMGVLQRLAVWQVAMMTCDDCKAWIQENAITSITIYMCGTWQQLQCVAKIFHYMHLVNIRYLKRARFAAS